MARGNGKIVIVGGGIAGLCAGVYGVRCGYDVELLEMHDRPGGLATNWYRNGYTFETCLYWLLGSNPQRKMHAHWREVFDIGRLTFVPPTEYARLEARGAEPLVIYTDPGRLTAELLRHSPEDAVEIHRFISAVREFRDVEIPEPPDGVLDWLGLVASLRHLPAVSRWAGMSLGEYSERFKNPLLRRFFGGGGTPELSAITVALALAWMGRRDADYPIGGSQAVINAIADSFRDLGGRLRLGARVHDIIVDEDTAVGVRLVGGECIRGGWVISAADGYATIYKMLRGCFVDAAIDEAYETLKPFPSYVQVSLGVATPMTGEPPFVTRVLGAPIEIDPLTAVDQIAFRIFNYDPTFAPAGKTAVTCQLPTRDYAYWTCLQRTDPEGYRREKDRLAELVIDVLDQRTPGARQAIEVIDVSTPATVIRYTGNWKGSMEGWLVTPTTGMRPLPMQLPGLRRFLMAGQWVQPGGGLPGGLMSARAALQALCRMDNRPFSAHGPAAPTRGPRVHA